MKVLILGFLSFIAWAVFSSWFYTCNIRHLCGEDKPAVIELIQEEVVSPEIKADTLVREKILPPVNSKVHFAYNSAEFTPGAEVRDFLQKGKVYLEENNQSILELVGHADATGPAAYNLNLGMRRAKSLSDYFQQNGIGTDQIKISSKGETEPIANNDTDEGRAKNRRVELTIKN